MTKSFQACSGKMLTQNRNEVKDKDYERKTSLEASSKQEWAKPIKK